MDKKTGHVGGGGDFANPWRGCPNFTYSLNQSGWYPDFSKENPPTSPVIISEWSLNSGSQSLLNHTEKTLLSHSRPCHQAFPTEQSH